MPFTDEDPNPWVALVRQAQAEREERRRANLRRIVDQEILSRPDELRELIDGRQERARRFMAPDEPED